MDQLIALVHFYGIRIDRVLGSILILAIGGSVIVYIRSFLRRLFLKDRLRVYFSYETISFAINLASVVMWISLGTLILNFWGISMIGLWTVLASITAVIGVGFLAVWTIVSNITASLFLTIWRPFHMGTTIEILPENLKGRVIDRNMMFTVLREEENKSTLYIPNNLFFQKVFRVTNSNQKHLFEYFDSPDPQARLSERSYVNNIRRVS